MDKDTVLQWIPSHCNVLGNGQMHLLRKVMVLTTVADLGGGDRPPPEIHLSEKNFLV